MKRRMKMLGMLQAVLALSIWSCSEEEQGLPHQLDGPRYEGLVTDGSVGEGTVGNEGSVGEGTLVSKDFVIYSMQVPTSTADVTKYAYDIDGDGTKDNAMGTILVAIHAAATGSDMKKDMNQNILNGNIIGLHRISATSFTGSSSATIQGWTGEAAKCCSNKPCSESEAKQTCFSGSYSFKVAASSPTNATLTGTITSGSLDTGPGSMSMLLPIGKFSASVTMLKAKIRGKVSTSGITDGLIMGAISQNDLKNSVLPAVAKALDFEMKDPATSQATKNAIKKVFDTDNDGTISSAEVVNHPAIQALTAGDVDATGDGKKEEFSVGVGFTSVGCTIQP